MTSLSPRNLRARAARSRAARALAPHWGALLALALFLIAGLVALDDHGVGSDEVEQRLTAEYTFDYILRADAGIVERGAISAHGVFYGAAFELPLLLVERAFGLQDSRGVYLTRHLLTHLFFLAGGLFAYLLAARLFGARLLALTAMLIFLLHPRLYAHSFFNTKDIPFLVAFIIALYLARGAFRRDMLWAFALLGIAAGALVNLRIMGVVLFAAVLAARTLDFAFALGWAERKRVLLSTGAFALMSLLTIYALLPYLWADPVGRAVEWWTTLSNHPTVTLELFRGILWRSDEFPADYAPAWFSITTPPFALLLGLVGGALILFRTVTTPRRALRNTRLRFGLLLAGCFALPILAVALLAPNLYNDWRHLYFLWTPFAPLAAWGLRGLAGALPQRLQAAVYGATSAGLAATVVSMALIHPNQQLYFNALVDRVTSEHLRAQYVMYYSSRQALEWLSDNADILPDNAAATTGASNWAADYNARILPDAARARIEERAEFEIVDFAGRRAPRSVPAFHRAQVYGATLFTIERKDDLRAVYAATRGREPDAVAVFDAHRLDGAVALVMEPCAPAFIEHVGATLWLTPVDPDDLPPWREGKRDEPRGFSLLEYGAFFDGKCVASLPLPDYPLAEFRLVRRTELLERESAREAMRRAKEEGRLLARAEYDVYMANGELAYVREDCDPLETEHPFRVSVFPQRSDDLPEEWRERGHQRFWFDFYKHGALLEEGMCVALFPLPDYPIAAIQTGQLVEDGGDLWEAALSANPEPYATAYRAVAGREPLARGAFDVHLLDGDLVYVKEPCKQADTGTRFFLHIVPDRVGDLPEGRRELGFDNLDFRFFLNGAWFDGQCAARVPLPDYPIASIRTGQFVSGAGEIWSAEFAVGR